MSESAPHLILNTKRLLFTKKTNNKKKGSPTDNNISKCISSVLFALLSVHILLVKGLVNLQNNFF